MKKKSLIKFLLWFLLLSTLGVGGGIFFLLFAVVPIEEWYVSRGWSQYKIDSVMKYYVFGWVIFGFIVSFIYYFFVVKKERWKSSTILCLSSVLLCGFALYYFLNTNSSIVQASQGEVEVGQRFTFGPYPEKVDLERLKEEGYDGVIALLSDTLPIEKPLIDKLLAEGAEVGIEIYSMPMLPWVGDNTETLNQIRELVEKDEKRYYIHCYLGRHRVDVVKQLVSQYTDEEIDVLFLQPTSFERGDVYYDAQNEVIFGPYPTDEEWFTRIRRGEVQEVLSLLRADSATKYTEQEKKVVKELNITYSNIPIEREYTLEDLQNIVQFIQSQDKKIFVHKFSMDSSMQELVSLYRYGKTIYPLNEVKKIVPESETIEAKYIIGPPVTEDQKKSLMNIGVEQFLSVSNESIRESYKMLNQLVEANQITYIETATEQIDSIYTLLFRLYNGFENYKLAQLTSFIGMNVDVFTRNLSLGPIIDSEEEIETYILNNGIHKVIYIAYLDINEEMNIEKVKELYSSLGVNFEVISYDHQFPDQFIPKLNYEQHSVYLMSKENLLNEIRNIIEKY